MCILTAHGAGFGRYGCTPGRNTCCLHTAAVRMPLLLHAGCSLLKEVPQNGGERLARVHTCESCTHPQQCRDGASCQGYRQECYNRTMFERGWMTHHSLLAGFGGGAQAAQRGQQVFSLYDVIQGQLYCQELRCQAVCSPPACRCFRGQRSLCWVAGCSPAA